MINDTHLYPSSKHKGLMPEQNLVMTSSVGPLRGSIPSEVPPKNGIALTKNPQSGGMCACIRSTESLKDPISWNHLVSVQELTIKDEQHAVKTIPEGIYCLRNLHTLTVNWSDLQVISPDLGAMQLTQLHLCNNKLDSIDPVSSLRSLTVLNLAVNNITTLPKNIGNLISLRELNLRGNQLTELPTSIGELTALNELGLTSNRLSCLPPIIGSLQELRILDVSLNRLSSLPTKMGSLANLTTCILSHNQLSMLPDTFSGLTRLKWLFLRSNKFTEVPDVLCGLPCLDVLSMNENIISTISTPLPYIKHLLLNRNEFDSFPDNILACKNLISLSLENNNITIVPEDISRLTSLRVLHLGGNDFDTLPPDMGDLQELRHLSLNDSRIEHLPARMESLRGLSLLNLENTQITGGWMAAYRQGIPALLEYARTTRIRDAVSMDYAGTSPKGSPLHRRKKDKQKSGTNLSLKMKLRKRMSLHGKSVEEVSTPRGSPVILRHAPKRSSAFVESKKKKSPEPRRASAHGSPTLPEPSTNGSPATLSGLPATLSGSPATLSGSPANQSGSPASPRAVSDIHNEIAGIRTSNTAVPTIVTRTPNKSPATTRRTRDGSVALTNGLD